MSANLHKQLPRLMTVASLKKPHTRCEVLKELTKDKMLCSACREVLKNVKSSNIKLTAPMQKKLQKDQKILKDLLKQRVSHGRQRKLIIQAGKGFMLPLLIPLVAEAIGFAVRKAQGQ